MYIYQLTSNNLRNPERIFIKLLLPEVSATF